VLNVSECYGGVESSALKPTATHLLTRGNQANEDKSGRKLTLSTSVTML
jgi:hypothetical protein